MMVVEIGADLDRRLRDEKTIWLTTVSPDGIPQPIPVWYWWDGDTFLIFSQPTAKKLRNIAQNPKVALNLSTDEWGNDVVIIGGEASVDPNAPPSIQLTDYIDKYRQGIADINMTPESLSKDFSVAIRVKPTRVRAE